MKDTPLVSIALCTYNGGAFLKEQIDSVLAQDYDNWEMFVVDDLSTDHTWEILESYAGDERIHLHRNTHNLGYNRNFEKALKMCRGEYIAICDQDDIWHPQKLSKQLSAIGSHQLIYHDSQFVDEKGKPMHIRISDKFHFYRGDRPEPFIYMNCVSGHSILLKRTLLEHALPFPTDFHYDQWLAFVAASHGTIDFVDECLVSYRQHRNNNTDLLATSRKSKNSRQKIEALERESDWLYQCSRHEGKGQELIDRLYSLCSRRNVSFASVSYGNQIWENRGLLLYLLKKSDIQKFFFTLRKIWGPSAKTIA